MKQDERGLATLHRQRGGGRPFDRSVEHFLKFHADTMVLVGRAIAADPGFVMGHCLKALPAADRGEPRQSGADRRNAGRRTRRRDEHNRA